MLRLFALILVLSAISYSAYAADPSGCGRHLKPVSEQTRFEKKTSDLAKTAEERFLKDQEKIAIECATNEACRVPKTLQASMDALKWVADQARWYVSLLPGKTLVNNPIYLRSFFKDLSMVYMTQLLAMISFEAWNDSEGFKLGNMRADLFANTFFMMWLQAEKMAQFVSVPKVAVQGRVEVPVARSFSELRSNTWDAFRGQTIEAESLLPRFQHYLSKKIGPRFWDMFKIGLLGMFTMPVFHWVESEIRGETPDSNESLGHGAVMAFFENYLALRIAGFDTDFKLIVLPMWREYFSKSIPGISLSFAVEMGTRYVVPLLDGWLIIGMLDSVTEKKPTGR